MIKTLFAKLALAFALLAVFSTATDAHNKVVVIPLGADDPKPLRHVYTVSPKNGDYPTLQAAIAGIPYVHGDKYLIFVGPGEYTHTAPVTIKFGMTVVGSGKTTTYISGGVSSNTIGSNAALITLENSAVISDMEIVNQSPGSGGYAIGLLMNAFSYASNIAVSVRNPQTNGYAVVMNSGGTLTDSTAYVTTIGSTTSIALAGIYVWSNTTGGEIAEIENVRVISDKTGLTDFKKPGTPTSSLGAVHIRNAEINGTAQAIVINNPFTQMVQSQVSTGTGGALITDNVSGTQNCLDVYDDNLGFQTC